MKRSSILFLQAAVAVVAVIALVVLLIEPHFEGRNVDATWTQIYFGDPFLAYAYAGSIPFFAALRQAFKALDLAGSSQAFSQATLKSLRIIRNCALAMIGVVVAGVAMLLSNANEDRPPLIAMGVIGVFCASVAAAAAATLERVVRKAVELKSENDLTV